MYLIILLLFIFGYIAIALEHPLKIDKSASAILTGVLCWTALILGGHIIFPEAHDPVHEILHSLEEHLSEISGILFFLLGAMTVVELIDAHRGFSVITESIKTTNKVKLLWMLSGITFFMSAALDNLTTAIVMAALLRKLIPDKNDLWFFAGMVVIAANAGGAWSPIGDVTTIMLWIGGEITAINIIKEVFLPSLVAIVIPLAVASIFIKGKIGASTQPMATNKNHHVQVSDRHKYLVFTMGIGLLLFVPVFKTVTHLPPFMGILLALGILWLTTEILHRNDAPAGQRSPLSVVEILRRVDVPSVLFFLGILLAVAALQTAGHLTQLATILDQNFKSIYVVNTLIGLLSAVVDNVPLVAGAMGMYSMEQYPQDHAFWELLAFCAGTGGSNLIIGSAAGVAIMGILKIDFLWYLRRISWLALIGYFSGILMYMLLQ
ncbi:MAG: sodium:proton antiporter [Saprospiraceae bacterium]|nr:MAG: sodium:proton antiporter [Saprospiraceae bacterium]